MLTVSYVPSIRNAAPAPRAARRTAAPPRRPAPPPPRGAPRAPPADSARPARVVVDLDGLGIHGLSPFIGSETQVRGAQDEGRAPAPDAFDERAGRGADDRADHRQEGAPPPRGLYLDHRGHVAGVGGRRRRPQDAAAGSLDGGPSPQPEEKRGAGLGADGPRRRELKVRVEVVAVAGSEDRGFREVVQRRVRSL